MTKRFKFLNKGLKSAHGKQKWKVGKWYDYEGELEMCSSGFHCSKGIYQAFSFVQGELLAEVEVKGKHLVERNKEVWQEMKVTRVYKWKKVDSVLFSIYAARLVLDIFEKYDPKDSRPREAIEAAERYIKNPTKKNKDAAHAAADAAHAAADAAYAAAYTATDAAYAAAHAAADAAHAAADAAYAATDAAADAAYAATDAAAYAAVYKKLDTWMKKHLKDLEVLK